MAHIKLGSDQPGILGLFDFRPETAGPLNSLAETLLRGPSTLSRGERELIASLVSSKNECSFCTASHSAFAQVQLDGGRQVVDAVKRDYHSAPISDKLKALLRVAELVQKGGRHVTTDAVEAARQAGATDLELHDTVLIAAAFCMYNRYVDGLGTMVPSDSAAYDQMARHIVEHGYGAPK